MSKEINVTLSDTFSEEVKDSKKLSDILNESIKEFVKDDKIINISLKEKNGLYRFYIYSVSPENSKKSEDIKNIEYPLDLFKNGFEPEFTKNDMFKSFLFCSIGQAVSEAIGKYKRYYMVPESLEKSLRFIIKNTAKSIIKEVKKQKK
jgi:hypothetical protein